MQPLPPLVERLLQADDDASRQGAWQAFVEEYSRLILHVARSQTGSYDTAMDRYAYILERLRADDFQRVRAYRADGRGKFTTWLVVVARRLGVDEDRQRYGRNRGSPDASRRRRDLVDLVGSDVDVDLLPAANGSMPGEDLRARELRRALAAGIDQLETTDRLLLRLRFQDDVAVTEIARILAFPSVFHVYRRLSRIYDQLRTILKGMGIEDPAP